MGIKTHADPWAPGEMWDLYDVRRRPTGLQMRRGLNIPDNLYHIIVACWIRNDRGEYLMSFRDPEKKLYGGLWECTGGCVVAGENSLDGAVREVREELGVELDRREGELVYSIRRDRWQDFYDAWLFHANVPLSDLRLQSAEVADARWMSLDDIADVERAGKLYPLISYYRDVLA
ncbi:MAG: NUDIX domain-containing protein [Coriobacteriales bacterium]